MEGLASTPAPGSTPCPAAGAKGWRSQFRAPRGVLGRWVGRFMAVKNAAMNRYAVAVLDPQPQDRVLEIGFGAGRTLDWIAERVPRGRICGLDPSPEMLRLAAAHLRAPLAEGRAELALGVATRLPWPDAVFERVLASNNVQFWEPQERGLEEIRRVLVPGGCLVLALRRLDVGKPARMAPGFRQREVDALAEEARRAGFRQVRCETRELPLGVTCLVAER